MPDDPTPKNLRFRDVNPELKTYRSVAPENQEEKLEGGWTKEPGASEPSSNTLAFAILGLLAAAIVGGVIYVISKKPEEPAPSIAPGPAVEHRTDEERRQDIENVLDGFFAAQTVEERRAFVIDSEPVRQRMEQYYREQQTGPVEKERIESVRFVLLNREPWAWVSLHGELMGTHVAALKEVSDSYKIDWESLVGYGEMSWAKFFEERPAKPVQMRVLIQESDYYNYKYEDPKEYASYRIDRHEFPKTLYGFVKRDSETHKKLQDSVAPGTSSPVSIRIFWEADAGGDNLVVIEDILFTLWTNPALLEVEQP